MHNKQPRRPAMKGSTFCTFLIPLLLSIGLVLGQGCVADEDCRRPCSGNICEGPWCIRQSAGQATGTCIFVCVPRGRQCPVSLKSHVFAVFELTTLVLHMKVRIEEPRARFRLTNESECIHISIVNCSQTAPRKAFYP